MHRATIALTLLAVSSLYAQGLTSSSSRTALTLGPQPSACPVSMHARHGVWDHTRRVHPGKDQDRQNLGQRIVLTLTGTQPAPVVAATVLVRGFNGENRIVQTGSSSGDATKTLKATFIPQSDGSVAADLFVSGFTAVTYLWLQDVSYADGSIWKIDSADECRVAPDPLMLIAAH